MMERGLTRNPANPTPATYYVSFVGMVPEMDSKMSVDDYFLPYPVIQREDTFLYPKIWEPT